MAKRPANADVEVTAHECQVHVFGVRHLSPGGAWHLRRFLDRIQPKVVLIEGLADANELIPDITRNGSVPPIAILAYTEDQPVQTLVYPIARYSPEYQALMWARENKARAEFIDLPSDVFLALQRVIPFSQNADADDSADDSQTSGDEFSLDDDTFADDSDVIPDVPPDRRVSVYDQFAEQAGEPDYDAYWERRFEHNCGDESYRLAAVEFGSGLRELEQRSELSQAENLVREAFMRRRIQETIRSGNPPEKIVAVVGAFHAGVLSDRFPAMTDDELASLKRRSSRLTLMPYSYFKLSSQSGYGAGNHAPAYFELLWDALEDHQLHELPARYLSRVARNLRGDGTHRSTAEVIEGVRLARTLSALKDGLAPALVDLQDAAVTLFGHGDRAAVSEAMARVDVGTSIGKLPKGVSRTSIQDDFERELSRLKLAGYRETVRKELALDLRENRRVKTEEAAFLDLHRSSFLHRLRILNVSFGELQPTSQQSATWAERWHLQWTPESEIQIVEAVLLGETIEVAAAYQFKTALEKCSSVRDAAAMVHDACRCGLMKSMEHARRRLQELAAENSEFTEVAHAAHELGMVCRYGDVRQFDPKPLLPLIDDLFVQGSLALHSAANCDNDAARGMAVGIDEINRVCFEYHDRVDEELWVDRLKALQNSDDRNPLLSGLACAILLERGLISNDELAREVSRRLSPGISADLGAGWFEGLAGRNRYALLARQPLWEQLARYIESLDDDQFHRALVFLRRAFGSFSASETRQIAENLGEFWGVGGDLASELMSQPLTEQEEQVLEDLNDFDFDDL
ncbi:MAG: DUF5682 family protein [Planctomycetaceae bacterium]